MCRHGFRWIVLTYVEIWFYVLAHHLFPLLENQKQVSSNSTFFLSVSGNCFRSPKFRNTGAFFLRKTSFHKKVVNSRYLHVFQTCRDEKAKSRQIRVLQRCNSFWNFTKQKKLLNAQDANEKSLHSFVSKPSVLKVRGMIFTFQNSARRQNLFEVNLKFGQQKKN